jgi:MerR family transcriptional regulator, copper efflux regulator
LSIMGMRISELAEQADIPVSTVRYYERIGLLRPPERQGNGYRRYDESDAEQLAFIGRAKRMGIPLVQVSELIGLWSSGGCRPMQEQIRAFLTGRVAEVRAQRTELAAFAHQLEALLGRIDGTGDEDRLCQLDCECVHLDDVDPLAGCERFPAVAREHEVGCSLEVGQQGDRLRQWRDLVDEGRVVDRSETTLRVAFPVSTETAERLAGLCAAEVGCCSFFAFRVEISAASLTLQVEVPAQPEARQLMERLFGPRA